MLIWGLLWATSGWLIGILAYFGGGLLALATDNDSLRNRVANYYSRQAMGMLGRAALVERGTKWDVYSTSHIAEKNVDEITIDGNTGHISNDTGLLSTLHKKPFGLVLPPEEKAASYVSPELAELGRRDIELEEQGNLVDDEGRYREYVTVSTSRPLVQLSEYARRMVHGSRNLWDLQETEEFVKQSKIGFGSPKTQQYMILVVAYCAAVLLGWLVMTNAGGAAPTGISVPGIGG